MRNDPRILALGRWLLLLLLAGHLLLRREFAHRSVGELFGATSGWLGRAYVTETALLVLLALAAMVAWRRWHERPATATMYKVEPRATGLGPAVFIGIAFLAWG